MANIDDLKNRFNKFPNDYGVMQEYALMIK